jgi:phosphoribosylanthranilate isomerase
MTDAAQISHAVSLGVDAIGIILHADSPRTISLEEASLLRASVPAFVSLVGVFVDASRSKIERAIDQIGLDLVQLHGKEPETFATTLSRPYIKAIRARSIEQVTNDSKTYPSARALLLDPYVKGQEGGTGISLDNNLWPHGYARSPLILAGGLSADNVASRIDQLSPFAVDINSGVELSPGIKDPELVASAVREVYLADSKRGECSNDS